MRKIRTKIPYSYFLSALLPALIMMIIYAIGGIYPGGERTVLSGDGYTQYLNFHVLFRDVIHNGEGLLYTFKSGLGLNLYAFASYYLGSFLMPFTLLFSLENMPDALYWMTIIKFALMGLTSYWSFMRMYPKLTTAPVLIASLSYALMSFFTSQSAIIMWLDVFILLPLILCGLHQLMDQRKLALYYVTLSLLFIQNYYFGFMIAIFLTLYFFGHYSLHREQFWLKFRNFAVVSVLSGITSLVMLLPMFLDLKSNGESLSEITSLSFSNTWWLDLVAKNFVGAYDTTMLDSIPMIYVGMFILMTSLLFFVNTRIDKKAKIVFASIIIFMSMSFYLKPLDFAWQGMHEPNMFWHRYSFLFSTLLILLSLENLSNLQGITTRSIVTVTTGLAVLFITTYFTAHYDFLSSYSLFASLIFLAYYCFCLIFSRKGMTKLLYLATILVFLEVGINSMTMFMGAAKEWNYASYDRYNGWIKKNKQSGISDILATEDSFVRTETTDPETSNDGMKYSYNALSQFSSVRNRKSSSTLNELGFKSLGTNLSLGYKGNTILMDAIFGIKYNINYDQPHKYNFKSSHDAVETNTNALPVGFIVKGGYHDLHFAQKSTNLLDNQTKFMNELSKQQLKYFESFSGELTSHSGKLTSEDGLLTITKGNAKQLKANFVIQTKAHTQAYLQIPMFDYAGNISPEVIIKTPRHNYKVLLKDHGSLFNLGYYEDSEIINISISVPRFKKISFSNPTFVAVNVESYKKAIAAIQANPTSATQQKNGLLLTTNSSDTGNHLFITLPYDKGWSATIDGKPTAIKQAQTGFMKIDIPKGTHRIEMSFVPRGLVIGFISSIVGVISFILYATYSYKKTSI
jgi:uncharacterized membrane protein YfhO